MADDPPRTLVPKTVEVPSSLRRAPFNQSRMLLVPAGFKISVVARIPRARFIMPLATGACLVAQPSNGRIWVVWPQTNGMTSVSTLIDGLRYPQGMALHSIGNRLYLYVGESNQISRFVIARDGSSAGEKTVIVPDLPDSSSPELHGYYRHELKNLVIGSNGHRLFVECQSERYGKQSRSQRHLSIRPRRQERQNLRPRHPQRRRTRVCCWDG